MRQRACRPLANDQMRFHSRPVQHLQQSHTEDRSGCASDADDEACGLRLFHARYFSHKKAQKAHNEDKSGIRCYLLVR